MTHAPRNTVPIPNAWPISLAPRIHAVLKPFMHAKDRRMQMHLNAFATFQCPIQVDEFCTMWQEAKKGPGLLHQYMIGFRRLAFLDGPGSFLTKSDASYQAYANCLEFPEPLPLAGEPAGKATVMHMHDTRKKAQRYFREGLRNLQGVGLEHVHPEDRPALPRVKPRTQVKLPDSTPLHDPDAPERSPLTEEQLDDLRGTAGAAIKNSDALQSAAYVALQEETKYRPNCMVALRGCHLVWNRHRTGVDSINPPPGPRTRPNYPQDTPRTGKLLAAHVQRHPGVGPGQALPDNELVFRNRNGRPLTAAQAADVLNATGRLEEIEGLISSRLRAGVITHQAFNGTSFDEGPLVNGRRGHLTDWIYFRPELEPLLFTATCDAEAVPRIEETDCCKACGDLGTLNSDLLCIACDPKATAADAVTEDRLDELAKLAAELEKEIPKRRTRGANICVSSVNEARPGPSRGRAR